MGIDGHAESFDLCMLAAEPRSAGTGSHREANGSMTSLHSNMVPGLERSPSNHCILQHSQPGLDEQLRSCCPASTERSAAKSTCAFSPSAMTSKEIK